jgi:hypothetical protein
VTQFGRPPAKHGDQGTIAGGASEEVRQRVGPLGKLDRLDAGFLEQHPSLEDVHRCGIEPGTEVDETAPFGRAAFYQGGGRFGGEAGGMQLIIVEQDTDDTGPFERGERGVGRAAGHVIKREKARCFPRPEDELRERLGAVGKAPDGKGFLSGHVEIYTGILRRSEARTGTLLTNPEARWSLATMGFAVPRSHHLR